MENCEEFLLRQVKEVENNMVISDDQKIADIFIEYFDVIVPKLGLAIPKNAIFAINGFEELKALYKYQRCPSILALKEKYKDQLSLYNLQSELKNLDSNIPTKVLKENMDTSSPFLLNYFNDIINSSSFQVTSLRVTSYFLHTSYELVFIARVKS